MPETPAQRKANAKYRESGKVKQIGLKFFPKDHDIYDWVKSQPKSTAYVLSLIRTDMENHQGQS